MKWGKVVESVSKWNKVVDFQPALNTKGEKDVYG